MISTSQLEQFRSEGYVIIEGIDSSIYETIRQAAERVTAKGRSGAWPHVRQVPDRQPRDILGVSSLLHPDLEEPTFAHYMATPQVLDVAKALLQDKVIRLSLTNMLVNPAHTDYAIGWHRDATEASLEGDDEMAALNCGQWGVQWNAALYRDDCLRIVPGSHRRNMTEAERGVLSNRSMDPMPGELRVSLQVGQTVYYNANLLHKGDYSADQSRLTLHANLVSMREPIPFAGHYEWVKFMAEPGFRATLPEALIPLHDNWLEFVRRCQAITADDIS